MPASISITVPPHLHPIPEHIANGMYGGILVEPVGGLPKVEKEYYVVQSEFYTKPGKKGDTLEFSFENGLAEHPSHVMFNGMAGSLVKNPLTAKVGDTIRMFYINAGPNLTANWHVIGEIFDRVYPEGSLITPPLQNVQTTVVPAGGSSMAEFKVEVPGTYINVDHAIFRIAKGAVGLIKVEGSEQPDIYKNLLKDTRVGGIRKSARASSPESGVSKHMANSQGAKSLRGCRG